MNRIAKEWITSLIGVIIMLIGSYNLYMDKDLKYNIIIIVMGFTLLYAKDGWALKIFKIFLNKFK